MTQIISVFIALGLVVGLLYVLWKPRWAIVLVLLMFPIEQLLTSYSPAFSRQSWVLNVLIGSVGLLALASTWARPGSRIREVVNPASMAILGLYVVAGLGLLWTPARDEAIGFMKTGLPYYALFLVIAPALLDDLEDFRRIVFPLMVVGGLIAVLILVHPRTYFYGGRLFLPVGGEYADGGGNPLELGRLGGNIAVIAVLLRPPRTATILMLLRAGAFLVGFGLAIGSGSRGQVIAAMLVVVAFFPMARRLDDPKRFVIAAIGMIILLVGFYLAFKLFVGSSNQARWSLGLLVQDLGGRFEFVLSLMKVYVSSPGYWLLGLGPNAFAVVTEGSLVYVHNLVVEVLCEEGLVGFALLLVACVFAAKRGQLVWRAHGEDSSFRSAAAILAALAAYNLLLALKQSTFLASPMFFMYLLILAKVSVGELALIASGEVEPLQEDDDESAYEYDESPEESGYGVEYGPGDVQTTPG